MITKQVRPYVGSMSQLAAATPFRFQHGSEGEQFAVRLFTADGWDINVMCDRGMDIGAASYKGMPVAWCSPAGFAHPHSYDANEFEWLRTFGGGMLATCGLTQVGSPCEDEGEVLGLHGRAVSLSASNLSWGAEWQDDAYVCWVEGTIRQAKVFGENISLQRRISITLGSPKVEIHDTVCNEGFSETPLMLLHHMNFGYPLVDADTVIECNTSAIEPRNDHAALGIPNFNKLHGPTAGYEEEVFYPKAIAEDGWCKASLVNKSRKLSVSVQWKADESPMFTLWKMLGQGEYVIGLEPSNCHVTGRADERKHGSLQYLQPGDVVEKHINVIATELS